ncbi:MAG: hypothetical protein WAY88_00260 [Minisyncoccia bacterium]
MNKKIITIIVIICAIVLFFIYINKSSRVGINDTNCSQYTDLINRKIKESDRVLKNEGYTLNEIFYSPRMNTCLYAFTVHTSQMYGGSDLYFIYDFFGGAIFGGGTDTDFQIKRIDLKR